MTSASLNMVFSDASAASLNVLCPKMARKACATSSNRVPPPVVSRNMENSRSIVDGKPGGNRSMFSLIFWLITPSLSRKLAKTYSAIDNCPSSSISACGKIATACVNSVTPCPWSKMSRNSSPERAPSPFSSAAMNFSRSTSLTSALASPGPATSRAARPNRGRPDATASARNLSAASARNLSAIPEPSDAMINDATTSRAHRRICPVPGCGTAVPTGGQPPPAPGDPRVTKVRGSGP
mmetsp:Transcript_78688/g.228383  ORF Transcript_78688/g.228383 Transcript_78688/m.228383 type:complete len:238 (+) Transcript_78688:373-1086(+)